MISNRTELKIFYCNYLILPQPLLTLARNHNLQQLYIHSPNTNVPDHFMTSVSAHGGLVHVVMMVGHVTCEGITSLVRNSPKLITLQLCANHVDGNVENFNALLKMFWNRKLFTTVHYMLKKNWHDIKAVLREQGSDLLPLLDRTKHIFNTFIAYT